jgi:hypothetical protein
MSLEEASSASILAAGGDNACQSLAGTMRELKGLEVVVAMASGAAVDGGCWIWGVGIQERVLADRVLGKAI